jgi:branched-chain amino acid aminotransferase
MANIFWLKDGQLYTPPLSEGCVAGVMRRYIIERIPVTESMLDTDTLYVADEVFLTNTIRRIKWVSVIADKTYSNTLTRKLYSQLFA